MNKSTNTKHSQREYFALINWAPTAFAICTDKWWRMTGSNRRPPACKAGALPAELIPQDLNFQNSSTLTWWVWLGSNQRPLRYQHSALTSWATDPSWFCKEFQKGSTNWIDDQCCCLKQQPIRMGVRSAKKASFPERRWSSRTFRYGYLVTTSPQSRTLPW